MLFEGMIFFPGRIRQLGTVFGLRLGLGVGVGVGVGLGLGSALGSGSGSGSGLRYVDPR